MGAQLAEVIPLDCASTNGFELVKPCSYCERPAAYKIAATTGLDEDAIEMRACVEHALIVVEHNAMTVEKWNAKGAHPVLFPWLVTVERYIPVDQRCTVCDRRAVGYRTRWRAAVRRFSR